MGPESQGGGAGCSHAGASCIAAPASSLHQSRPCAYLCHHVSPQVVDLQKLPGLGYRRVHELTPAHDPRIVDDLMGTKYREKYSTVRRKYREKYREKQREK